MALQNYLHNYAYVTLLANDEYYGGVIALSHSLKLVNSKYPLIVLITENCSISIFDKLLNQGIKVKRVPLLTFNKINLNNPRYKYTLSKIHLLNLIEFDKICFLDADIIVTKNMDCLLDNNDILFTYRKDGLSNRMVVSGAMFIIEPKTSLYSFLLHHSNNCDEDESLWTEAFPYRPGLLPENLYQDNYYYHMRSVNKWWISLNDRDIRLCTQDAITQFKRNKKNQSKNLYVTLLSTDNYAWGVIGLYYSFLQTNSKYPFLCLVTENCSKETIALLNQYNIPHKVIFNEQFSNKKIARYQSCFNKFYIYLMTEYEKIAFLDADIILLRTLDDYFDKTSNGILFFSREEDYIDTPLASGTYFIITPDEQKYYYIKEKYQHTAPHDEAVFTEEFSSIISNFDSIFELGQRYFHWGYAEKYWEYLGYSESKIYTLINRVKKESAHLPKKYNGLSQQRFQELIEEVNNI